MKLLFTHFFHCGGVSVALLHRSVLCPGEGVVGGPHSVCGNDAVVHRKSPGDS